MKDLIERLEKATGPDRDLDAAIWGATMGTGADAAIDWRKRSGADWFEKYTSSLDAAMKLVPKGSSIHAHIFTHYDGATSEVEVGAGKKGSSTTPAIALCIAALKSQQWVADRNATITTSQRGTE